MVTFKYFLPVTNHAKEVQKCDDPLVPLTYKLQILPW